MVRRMTRGARVCTMAILAISGLALLSCGGGDEAPESDTSGAHAEEQESEENLADLIAIQVAEVTTESISSLYTTSSTLRADKSATVIARTAGVTRRLMVEEGDRVAAGQVLAVLEDDEQRIEVGRTRTALQIEEQEFARAEKLHREELVSYEEHETARREFEDAKHASARAELELERTQVRAPFSGVVVLRHLDVGATVSDGAAVYELADVTPLYTDVNVPERHVARLAPGQTVRLHADSSGETVQARIERVAPSVDVSTGTVKVTLAVEGRPTLRPGAFVRVDIITDTHDDAMVVPRSALVADGSRWHLFRLIEAEDTVEQVEVVLGYEEADRVEVVDVVDPERTLRGGDHVVIVGASALTDGARVLIMEDEEPETANEEAKHEESSGASA